MTSLFHWFDDSRTPAHSSRDRRAESLRRRQGFHRRARLEALEPRMMLSWTVLTYLDADNNLESSGVLNVNQMETVGSTDSVKIAVQMDRSPGYDTTNGNWTDARRALIVYDTNTSTMTSLQGSNYQSIGEVNMGAQNTLTDFIRWGVANFPADHYVLNLWDHGGGLSGACWDDSSGTDHLTVHEIGAAIAAAGTHIDVLGFDACETGMAEVRHEVSAVVDVLVASEADIPGNGFPYDKFLADVKANPAMTAAQLGTAIVERYGQTYGASQTLSATNLANESALLSSLNNFAVAAQNAAEWRTITLARFTSASFTDPSYRDLGSLLSYVGSHAANSTLRSAAVAASSQYQASIISNFSGSAARGTGLSVYLPRPRSAIRSDYTAGNFRFVADSQWDEFLVRYTTRAPAVAAERFIPRGPTQRPEVLPPVEIHAGDLPASLAGTASPLATTTDAGRAGRFTDTTVQPVANAADGIAPVDLGGAAFTEARLESVSLDTSARNEKTEPVSATAADRLFADDRTWVGHSFEADSALRDA